MQTLHPVATPPLSQNPPCLVALSKVLLYLLLILRFSFFCCLVFWIYFVFYSFCDWFLKLQISFLARSYLDHSMIHLAIQESCFKILFAFSMIVPSLLFKLGKGIVCLGFLPLRVACCLLYTFFQNFY